ARQLALLGIKFSEDWEEHEKETDRLRNLYLRRYAGIGRYMEAREAYWLRTGTSVSYTGRVRHLPVPGREGKGYGHMLNQAINYPVQSLASDVTASAMMDFEEQMLKNRGVSYVEYLEALISQRKYLTLGPSHGTILQMAQLFNEVHDSLVVDAPPDRIKQDTDLLIDCMKSVVSLKKLAPGFDNSFLNVDVKVSTHWRSK
ncbi:MAG: DNA polymerase, partial [Terriglobia bacterium]